MRTQANFRVDLRDKTTVASMMQQVLDEFNVPGVQIYADNLFVTVDMLRWCNNNYYNLCGTTRQHRGFPDDFDWRNMEVWPGGVLSTPIIYYYEGWGCVIIFFLHVRIMYVFI